MLGTALRRRQHCMLSGDARGFERATTDLGTLRVSCFFCNDVRFLSTIKVVTMSARTNPKHQNSHPASNTQAAESKRIGKADPIADPTLRRAREWIQNRNYSKAANLLATAGRDAKVRNALGVCLMRMGKVDSAVEVFRSFVLMPGTVIERGDVNHASKRNFATALIMKGYPSGALDVLAETHDPDHPMAVRLREAIAQWEKSLPWLRWFDWKLNHIEPKNCHVPLTFEPGEFDFDVAISPLAAPDKALGGLIGDIANA